MLDLLHIVWGLLLGLILSLWEVAVVLLGFVSETLVWLHVGHPRLEGLLVGVALSWLMLRREKHPLLRVLSSPLKLVVDILDLAWDQVVEVVSDLCATAKKWVTDPAEWVKNKVTGAYSWSVGLLKTLKEKLTAKKD
jgi:hypothetical protein